MTHSQCPMSDGGQVQQYPRGWKLLFRKWSLWLTAAVVLMPAAARAGDLVVFGDGRTARVERAEVLPDRVRVETSDPVGSDLPAGVPFAATGPRSADVPRGEIRAVFPEPDLPGAARPHVERYGDITRRLTDQVHRDLERAWSLPSPAGR